MLQKVRGTRDLFPHLSVVLKNTVKTFSEVAELRKYDYISVPTLELEKLYKRTLGEDSDIVMKEMFRIQGKELVLRPEGTAGVMRAYLSSFACAEPKRWYYHGSMFRHERPQSGRYREFYQFGVENIGSPTSPFLDVDLIYMARSCLLQLGLEFKLFLNYLGTTEQRKQYTAELTEYFSRNLEKLSYLSKERFRRKNPLRILDSKEPEDQELVQQAPLISTYTADTHFSLVQSTLRDLGILYEIDEKLVRGLDYYSHTCFEFKYGELTLIAGGRYDALAEQLESAATVPAVGWAAGIDRISSLLSPPPLHSVLGVVNIGNTHSFCLKLSENLRLQGIAVVYDPSMQFKKQLQFLSKEQPTHVIFIGEEELARNTVKVKNFSTQNQREIGIEDLLEDPSIVNKI